MLKIFDLLPLLDDTNYRSGQELATHFDVTRATIHNCILRIESLGITIDRVPGLGYRLREPLDLLDQAAIVNNINPEVADHLETIECLQQVESTNQIAAKVAVPAAEHFSVVVAEMQTAGRGRRGRCWVSPFAANIYLSIVWPLQRPLVDASILSPYLAICVAESLHALQLPQIGLKWPNDIFCDGKKLAGLLIECSGELTGSCKMVIGLGVNVSMSRYNNVQIDQQWTDICSNACDWALGRSELAAVLINTLVTGLKTFEEMAVADVEEKWARWDVLHNTNVSVHANGSEQFGIARGIDTNGCLLLETTQGVEKISVGDISIREKK